MPGASRRADLEEVQMPAKLHVAMSMFLPLGLLPLVGRLIQKHRQTRVRGRQAPDFLPVCQQRTEKDGTMSPINKVPLSWFFFSSRVASVNSLDWVTLPGQSLGLRCDMLQGRGVFNKVTRHPEITEWGNVWTGDWEV